MASSPCIDAGDNTYAPNTKGLANHSRVINGTVDMGAYERFLVELDTDEDGVPDWWESRYYGGKTSAPALEMSSNGVDTIREAFLAGLDPKDPASRFAAQVIRGPGENPTIRWPIARGRVYSIFWTPSLDTGFTLLRADIPWTMDGFTDDENGSDGTGFYKIEVKLDN